MMQSSIHSSSFTSAVASSCATSIPTTGASQGERNTTNSISSTSEKRQTNTNIHNLEYTRSPTSVRSLSSSQEKRREAKVQVNVHPSSSSSSHSTSTPINHSNNSHATNKNNNNILHSSFDFLQQEQLNQGTVPYLPIYAQEMERVMDSSTTLKPAPAPIAVASTSPSSSSDGHTSMLPSTPFSLPTSPISLSSPSSQSLSSPPPPLSTPPMVMPIPIPIDPMSHNITQKIQEENGQEDEDEDEDELLPFALVETSEAAELASSSTSHHAYGHSHGHSHGHTSTGTIGASGTAGSIGIAGASDDSVPSLQSSMGGHLNSSGGAHPSQSHCTNISASASASISASTSSPSHLHTPITPLSPMSPAILTHSNNNATNSNESNATITTTFTSRNDNDDLMCILSGQEEDDDEIVTSLPEPTHTTTSTTNASSYHYTTTVGTTTAVAAAHESINFSKLMQQADDRNPIDGSSYYTVQHQQQQQHQHSNVGPDAGVGIDTDTLNKPLLSHNDDDFIDTPHTPPLSTSTNTTTTTTANNKKRGRNITVENIYPDSFRVTLPISYNVTTSQVMDVLSNPDLLHIWCDPITAICITERKGGSSLSSLSGTSSSGGSGNGHEHDSFMVSEEEYQRRMAQGSYRGPRLEEQEGDVIIRSEQEEEALNRHSREEHDGEWIQVTTAGALNPPPSHHNPLTSCVVNSRALLGFPCNGNVTMFVERNRSQVAMDIGPFKGGTMLSHTMTVTQKTIMDNGDTHMYTSSTLSPSSSTYIEVVDDVRVYSNHYEMGGERESLDVSCFCLNEIHHLLQEWRLPSIDGYIDQTVLSLEKLRDYVECGGNVNVHRYSMQ